MSSFASNQIVWAKVKGYPWWPAMVVKVKDVRGGNSHKDILVNFIGDNSHATLQEDKVVDFKEKFKSFSNGKSKKFLEAVKAAQRILSQESSYEEEKIKHHTRNRKSSVSVNNDDDDPEPLPKAEARPKKAQVTVQTVKETKLVQKERQKKDKKQIVYEQLMEFLPHRVTRSKAKTEHVEILTEPIIYPSRKTCVNAKREKEHFDDSDDQDDNDDNIKVQSRKTSAEIPLNKMGISSPADTFNAATSDESNTENTRREIESRQYILSKGNRHKKLFIAGTPESHQVICHQKDTSRISPERDHILGKLNVLSSIQQAINNGNNASKLTIASDTTHITPISFYRSSIKEFEQHLEDLMNRVTLRLKTEFKLNDNDSDMSQLLRLAEDFQKRSFDGSELVRSNVGKLIRTVHCLLLQKKHLLNKHGDLVITSFATTLRRIKRAILDFCLDNKSFMNSLPVLESTSQPQAIIKRPVTITAIDIEEAVPKTEEVVKKEENTEHVKGIRHVIVLDEQPEEIATKVEEEDEHSMGKGLKELSTASSYHTQHTSQDMDPGVSTESNLNICARITSSENTAKKSLSPNNRESILLLRKKVCQKLAKLLQESYRIPKEKSHEVTLRSEARIHELFANSLNSYKGAIQSLHKLIKYQDLSLEDLCEIRDMSLERFNEKLNEKIRRRSESDSAIKENLFENFKQNIDGRITREESIKSVTCNLSKDMEECSLNRSASVNMVLTPNCSKSISMFSNVEGDMMNNLKTFTMNNTNGKKDTRRIS